MRRYQVHQMECGLPLPFCSPWVVVTFKTGRKEIEELETQAQLFQHCSPARVTQCILLFLPPLAECSQECRERYLKTVARVKSSLKDRPWGWLWVERGTQMGLERALEGVRLVVAFGRGTSWRMRLGLGGTLSWLDGWSLGGALRWLAGWEAELDSGGVQDWVRRVNLGE